MELVKIQGKPYLVTVYKPKYAQIWKDGSGRDTNDGNWYGSILGYYTNLGMTVYFKDDTQVQQFIQDTRTPKITVEFYDPEIKGISTKEFYIGNYEIEVKGFYDDGADVYFDTTDIELVVHNKN